MVGVDAPVGQQVQPDVIHLPVQFLARQAFPAALAEDTQHRFGVLHFAYLRSWSCPVTCAPSPCGRPSRPPRQVVTPATTTGTVSPWGSRPVGDPTFVSAIRVERDVGAPLISFNALAGHRSVPRRFAARPPTPRRRGGAGFRRLSGGRRFAP